MDMQIDKELSPRWRGTTAAQRTVRMQRLAERKSRLLTKAQRKAHAMVMVAARGSWVMIDGNKVYVRNIKNK